MNAEPVSDSSDACAFLDASPVDGAMAADSPLLAGPGVEETSAPPTGGSVVLELRVRNHPGVMSHITGLFARRGFNLDAIVCVPLGDRTESSVWLLVRDEPRLVQVERQLEKLFDVLDVRHRRDLDERTFLAWAGR